MIKEMSLQDLVDENNELMEKIAKAEKIKASAEEYAQTEHERFEKLRHKYYNEINYYERKLNFYESRHPELQQEFDEYLYQHSDD